MEEHQNTESKHTPGPWKISMKTGDGKRIIVESDMSRDNFNCCRCDVDSDDCDSDMAMANARLIAAAPDLLAACQLALAIETADIDTLDKFGMAKLPNGRLDIPACSQKAADIFRAAISKAQGKDKHV